MMRRLQHIDGSRDPLGNPSIDVGFHISGEECGESGHVQAQDDRPIVQRATAVARCPKEGCPVWPEDGQVRCTDVEPISSGEGGIREAPRLHESPPARDRRSRAALFRTGCTSDPIAIGQTGEPSEVILVRVGGDDQVDAAIPGGDEPIELDGEPRGIGPTVDEHAGVAALDEDGITLPNVEDRDAQLSRGRCATALEQCRAGDERRTRKRTSSSSGLAARSGVRDLRCSILARAFAQQQRDANDPQHQTHPWRRFAYHRESAKWQVAPRGRNPRRSTEECCGRRCGDGRHDVERRCQRGDLARDDCDQRRTRGRRHERRDGQGERDLDLQGGADADRALHVEGAADLLDVRLHHVHEIGRAHV